MNQGFVRMELAQFVTRKRVPYFEVALVVEGGCYDIRCVGLKTAKLPPISTPLVSDRRRRDIVRLQHLIITDFDQLGI